MPVAARDKKVLLNTARIPPEPLDDNHSWIDMVKGKGAEGGEAGERRREEENEGKDEAEQ